jgi:hypothetical protein
VDVRRQRQPERGRGVLRVDFGLDLEVIAYVLDALVEVQREDGQEHQRDQQHQLFRQGHPGGLRAA